MKSVLVPQFDLKGKSFKFDVPASKSIANRALILAALRKGVTTLKGDFEAEDIQIMIEALRRIGIRIEKNSKGLRIKNDEKWRNNSDELELFLGNSGTSIRFLTSLVCFRKGITILTGKPRMLERPIGDLVDALRQIGAEIEYMKKEGLPPIRVIGHGGLKGGKVSVKADVSSQFLTSLMLIEAACERRLDFKIPGKTISKPYVEMTKNLLKSFPKKPEFTVEGDASAAVYWWALGYLHNANVAVTNVPKNSIQGDARFLDLLKSLDSGPLILDMNSMPDASLMLMAIGPLLKFPIRIVNIGSLRVKETDRIAAMATELGKIGVKVKIGRDWMKIWPLKVRDPSAAVGMTTKGGMTKVNTYDDHRIAMSMAILGTKLGNLKIADPDCVNKTYPGFWDQLKRF